MQNYFDLTGKVALVTGASRGLGRAMAVGLANAGADVVITDVLDTTDAVKEIESLGRKTLGIKVDVSHKKDVEAMVQKTVDVFGRLDILINNAGIYTASPAEGLSEEQWAKLIDINLKGAFLCAQAVGKQMMKQESGSIINIASVAGIVGSSEGVHYSCSKAGLILMTKTLAVEWGKYGIRVNAICPGLFHTDMTKDFTKDEGFMTMIKNRVPLGRGGQPHELASTAVYLASDASSYTTGHALVVDGGWTAGL